VGARAFVNVSVDGGQAYSATLCPTCGEHFQTCDDCREEDGLWSDIEECMRIQALYAEKKPTLRPWSAADGGDLE
jgi:predicted RNA-binding Zn-ribbon protein involved in translation (DUF1610 family)